MNNESFFDRIYPKLSAKLDNLEKDNETLHKLLLDIQCDQKINNVHFVQYKKKIQRIEQFLIENGLIKLMDK